MEGRTRHPPPTSGQWKPGQSGNPSGRPKTKPFKEALQAIIDKVGLEGAASALVAKANTGDVGAIKELGDRLDGKVPQGIENGDNKPFRMEIGWIQNASSLTTSQDDNLSDSITEQSDSPVSSPTAEPEKP